LQLREDRARDVRFEIDVAPFHAPPQQASINQKLQLALHGTLGRARLANDLPQVVPLPGVTV
jgi:hypothetical protein